MTVFALIHGAGGSGADWDLVADELRRRGHEVVAVDLPCDDDSAGWSEYADAVIAALPSTDDVAVVAHSLGGFTGTLVCARIPARLLVLVTAMVPRHGEPADAWWRATGHATAPGYDFSDEIALFLHDVPADLAVKAMRESRDQSSTPMVETWPLDAWPNVPTRFVMCTVDRFFPPDFMRRVVADRLPGVPVDELDASHAPYLSRPRELAELLDRYAAALRSRAARRREVDLRAESIWRGQRVRHRGGSTADQSSDGSASPSSSTSAPCSASASRTTR